ncbi:3,4-dihydroxy-2-butanone-4-phosphate synthase [Thiotrichales bacterium 19S3-7]|nr:3,4-dihydroxy-2-butanone-4-phosphate synthase [Thiotrichales bacterium 19S3-7]MCF6802215.1 3,4-dihydroxy-2-butanone-4-phosphate synthase [Thiotrichales bacterium 19S3-11]
MFNTTEELISAISNGEMVILLDDENRENEGDFVMAAEKVTPEAINFMARFGRGLVCMPMTETQCKKLDLPLMVPGNNRSRFGTNFTLSIEAKEGVTTGISAHDRAQTIRTAIKDDVTSDDLVKPGHIFPIMAKTGGVLTRAGHTEASCDLARLAALKPAAVLVEILNDDGTMARGNDLFKVALKHNLKIGTIADLIRYRIEHETTVEPVSIMPIETAYGVFQMHSYLDKIDNRIHFALTKGDITHTEEVTVRVHYQDMFADLIRINHLPQSWRFDKALEKVAQAKAGVMVLLSSANQPNDIVNTLERLTNDKKVKDHESETVDESFKTIGTGARILKDLGVKKMRLLSSPRRYNALSGFDLEVVEYIEGSS